MNAHPHRTIAAPLRARRAFTLIELLIALAITATLLVAMLMALQASFRAYQATVEEASTHVTARVVAARLQAMVRTGASFGPLPADARDARVRGDNFSATLASGETVAVRLDRASATLFVRAGDGPERALLSGVRGPVGDDGAALGAFTLEFDKGTTLRRASFDLTVERNPDTQLAIEGDEVTPLRLVGTASPRRSPW
jgi:prepilin-type N-terminal cleavage/methylation domain-containing protein